MGAFNLLPVNLTALAGVAFCLWVFFTSSLPGKTLETCIEVSLPKDGSKSTLDYDEAKERLRVQLRYDHAGRLDRWVGGKAVHSDQELMDEIASRRHSRWDLPVGIDALREMSWREIVRTMGLCERRGFKAELAAPQER